MKKFLFIIRDNEGDLFVNRYSSRDWVKNRTPKVVDEFLSQQDKDEEVRFLVVLLPAGNGSHISDSS